mmetsp:Transcript_26312/g.80965  ORF Transcript_26312/g.80965 Transcript_26312/m.80965 type:complete len:247 (+) Transcript_26312:1148-1888(+)
MNDMYVKTRSTRCWIIKFSFCVLKLLQLSPSTGFDPHVCSTTSTSMLIMLAFSRGTRADGSHAKFISTRQHDVCVAVDRERAFLISTGSTSNSIISLREYESPVIRKYESAAAVSAMGSPRPLKVFSTSTTPALIAAGCESAWPTKLHAAFPQVTRVALLLARIKPKTSLSVDVRSMSRLLPRGPHADIKQNIDAQMDMVSSSGRRERTETACTRPSFASRRSQLSVSEDTHSRFERAFAHTCFVK